jgi:hypothetical protein
MPAELAHLTATQWMRCRRAVLGLTDVQDGHFEVDLLPLQIHHFSRSEAMPVGQKHHQGVPVATAVGLCCLDEPVDFISHQVLTRAQLVINAAAVVAACLTADFEIGGFQFIELVAVLVFRALGPYPLALAFDEAGRSGALAAVRRPPRPSAVALTFYPDAPQRQPFGRALNTRLI